jgi:protoporphyrinogen oxidase
MSQPSVVILGGGLSGVATAYALGVAGWKDVTLVEREEALGGLAGGFEIEGHSYPLGYHHILRRDRTLLFLLDRIGALTRVRWRRIHMLFETAGRLFDLRHPVDFLRFPMPLLDKLRLTRLVLRARAQRDWSGWEGRDAAELLDAWASPGVRETLFEPLTRLKFELPCREVSAAWVGERLRYQEGSRPVGYIPGENWTRVLCDGMAARLESLGVNVRLGAAVQGIVTRDARVRAVELAGGETLDGDVFVSTLPPEVYRGLVPADESPNLAAIRYTALLSLVCATPLRLPRDFYWLNLSSLSHAACGLFVLSSLNSTIGAPGETCLNFVTHLGSRDRELFRLPDEELLALYRRDFRLLFGFDLKTSWTRLSRIPHYSPIFTRAYRNPPPRSTTFSNVHFAGTYRTHPSVASTGTAIQSGLECAEQILRELGQSCPLPGEARSFRPRHH